MPRRLGRNAAGGRRHLRLASEPDRGRASDRCSALILQPLLSVFYRRRVHGLEHLRGRDGPVMFAPNHHLHNDAALILCAIPLAWRWKLSVAAAQDDIFASPWRGFIAALLGNAFPMAREGSVRRSLDFSERGSTAATAS